jgi:4-amino-4-deoxy-L-arabinose transferase-like glycosyltransferase
MHTEIRHQFLILVTAVFVFFTGLGAARLWDEDEPEFARVAREMMIRGDMVTPTFNFHLFPDKPALLYWLMIGSYHLFGVTEFAARFPSALLAVGTALLAYHIGRRLFRPQVGLWAGLIMATNLMFAVIGRAASFDSTLVFFTTLSLLALVVAMGPTYWASGSALPVAPGGSIARNTSALARFRAVLPRSWWGFAAMYIPLGFGMMVKGPVGVLVPVAAIGLFVLFTGAAKTVGVSATSLPFTTGPVPTRYDTLDGCGVQFLKLAWRRLRILAADFPAATWAMRPLSLAAIVLAIALPWYTLVSIRTEGEFLKGFFLLHNGKYLMQPMDGHNGSIFYYPIVLVIFFFPWTTALLLGTIKIAMRIRTGAQSPRACILIATWSLTWIVLASMSGTKLPHYIAPAFPALAVIAGLWIADWILTVQSTAVQTVSTKDAISRLAAAPQHWEERWLDWGWCITASVGACLFILLPIVTHHYAPDAPSSNWLGLILLAGAIAGWLCQRWGRPAAAASMVLTHAVLFVCLFAVAAVPFSQQQTSIRMLNSIRRIGAESATIGTCRLFLPGLFFYADFDHPIIQVKKAADARDLFGSEGRTVLITDVDGFEELGSIVPDDARVIERQTRYLKGTTLLLVESPGSSSDGLPVPATTAASTAAANLK